MFSTTFTFSGVPYPPAYVNYLGNPTNQFQTQVFSTPYGTQTITVPTANFGLSQVGYPYYAIPPGALATEEVKVPAKPRKKTSVWRKKRVNAKARNRWENEIQSGRNLIIATMLDLFNGFEPLTVIIANYTLPSSIAGYLITDAKKDTALLPKLSLQEVPRCRNWKADHSPITDEVSIYCKGCRHFYCKECWEVCSELTFYRDAHQNVPQYAEKPTTRIPLSSIGVITVCHKCPNSKV